MHLAEVALSSGSKNKESKSPKTKVGIKFSRYVDVLSFDHGSIKLQISKGIKSISSSKSKFLAFFVDINSWGISFFIFSFGIFTIFVL